jgi:hypothetical protein
MKVFATNSRLPRFFEPRNDELIAVSEDNKVEQAAAHP